MIGLARQVMQQQLYVEEMTRSTGDSGLKKTRLSRTGSKSYFDTTYSGEFPTKPVNSVIKQVGVGVVFTA